ncbi:uncharacterized protein ACA1_342530 [Acanthamoeba castellanii str. Neff]|uniref:Uncharacterized protein n=1 Tax=Acanthamoeba castellanii (strain ATCC 30010 / Neff) TaxID=1257118 RepID=L8HCB0_ACACF|nr:uncharacterized protein ACA1_342530 [Acanthamoeba castellanii str. Neff]ELR23149.1 hypothetical protein ACA1_342530 [Acanthamoeba castellanii str. Neff]
MSIKVFLPHAICHDLPSIISVCLGHQIEGEAASHGSIELPHEKHAIGVGRDVVGCHKDGPVHLMCLILPIFPHSPKDAMATLMMDIHSPVFSSFCWVL